MFSEVTVGSAGRIWPSSSMVQGLCLLVSGNASLQFALRRPAGALSQDPAWLHLSQQDVSVGDGHLWTNKGLEDIKASVDPPVSHNFGQGTSLSWIEHQEAFQQIFTFC
ncbi:hypothetical protein H1C71_026103 [Ictidomys tridecemlineatus]|nr:hypothetical protein H1C71_026103 [Ictidomys tridecemlineatus]